MRAHHIALTLLAISWVAAGTSVSQMQPFKAAFSNTTCASFRVEGGAFFGGSIMLSGYSAVSANEVESEADLRGRTSRGCTSVPSGARTARATVLRLTEDGSSRVAGSSFGDLTRSVGIFTSSDGSMAAAPRTLVRQTSSGEMEEYEVTVDIFSQSDSAGMPSHTFSFDMETFRPNDASFAGNELFVVTGYTKSSTGDRPSAGAVLYYDLSTRTTTINTVGGTNTTFAAVADSMDMMGTVHVSAVVCNRDVASFPVSAMPITLPSSGCNLVVLFNYDPRQSTHTGSYVQPVSGEEQRQRLFGNDFPEARQEDSRDDDNDGGSGDGSTMNGMTGTAGTTGMTGMTGMAGDSSSSRRLPSADLSGAAIRGAFLLRGQSRLLSFNTTTGMLRANVSLDARPQTPSYDGTPTPEVNVEFRGITQIPGSSRVYLSAMINGPGQVVLDVSGASGQTHGYLGGGPSKALLIDYDAARNNVLAAQVLNVGGSLRIQSVSVKPATAGMPEMVLVTGELQFDENQSNGNSDGSTSAYGLSGPGYDIARRRMVELTTGPPVFRRGRSSETSFFSLMERTEYNMMYSASDDYYRFMHDYNNDRYVRHCATEEESVEACYGVRGPLGWTCHEPTFPKPNCDTYNVPYLGSCVSECPSA